MSAHRREENLRRAAHRRVERELGEGVICPRCGATLATFADVCEAELDDACPGFTAIDRVRQSVYAA